MYGISSLSLSSCGTHPARNYFRWTVLNAFITPDEQVVKETAEYIARTLVRDTIEDRAIATFNFVAINVIYTSDKAQFGKAEFWQYPRETLGHVFTDSNVARMFGDCEDSSFLLASLLLAIGVTDSNVRVGISRVHAWVECKLGNVWYLFESTKDKELDTLIPARSVVGKGSAYNVNVYVYQGGCRYGR